MPKFIDYICSACGKIVKRDVFYKDGEVVLKEIYCECECGNLIGMKQFPTNFIMPEWNV